LKNELDEIVKSKKINLTVIYTIDKSEENWNGEVGYINKDLISKYCENITSDDTFVLTCGPPLMCEFLKSVVKSMGVKDINIHDF
jgi:NAD(P)H-flavin reductase